MKYFFPLLVFGITDFDRQFFPIAFMVTSHETEEDFKYFTKEDFINIIGSEDIQLHGTNTISSTVSSSLPKRKLY